MAHATATRPQNASRCNMTSQIDIALCNDYPTAPRFALTP
jgi:hypothetical protein